MSARAINRGLRPLAWLPGQRACGEMMISAGWLVPCILRPQHDGAHLPSPYVNRGLGEAK